MHGLTTRRFVGEMMGILPSLIRGTLRQHADAITSGHITVPQFLVLEAVENRGPLKMSVLAEELRVSMPAATGLVDRLHALRVVERQYDPDDRRLILIAITPKGRRMVRTLRSKRARMIGSIFGRLTSQERADYIKILKRVQHVVYSHS